MKPKTKERLKKLGKGLEKGFNLLGKHAGGGLQGTEKSFDVSAYMPEGVMGVPTKKKTIKKKKRKPKRRRKSRRKMKKVVYYY